ncbi:hypothetical protein EGJ52_06215 [Pseudomonas luteola]|nr:hypothetical protein EGJ52_06215 [Pseudomonas luteola]
MCIKGRILSCLKAILCNKRHNTCSLATRQKVSLKTSGEHLGHQKVTLR